MPQAPTRLWSASRAEWVEKPKKPKRGSSQEEFFEYQANLLAWNKLFDQTTFGFESNARKNSAQKIKRVGHSETRRARLLEAFVENVDPLIVFNRDKWICKLCDHPVSKIRDKNLVDIASLDHIIPLSKGGSHSYANTQLAHLSCNIRKGNRA
jgi:hypothetical protein